MAMNPELIERIKSNKALLFIDAEEKREAGIQELMLQHESIFETEKKLAFLYIDNSIRSVSIFMSFFCSNHVIALLSPRLNHDFKLKLESIYNPFFIYDPHRKFISGYHLQNISAGISLHKNSVKSNYEINPSIKLLLNTSGTTGSPKFVKLSESNLLNNALSIIDYLPIKPEDTTPLNLPIYYSYGLSILTTNSIGGGRIVCTNKDILNKLFWTDLNFYNFTSLAGVPYVYEVLYRIGFTKKSYSSIRYMTQAGGRLNTELIKIFGDYARQHSILFYVMYGQTEATARMSYLDPKFLAEKPGSIGKPILHGSFHIDDNTGELIYKGPNVYGGYAQEIKDLQTFETDQELKTGDITFMDGDGFYYITGRMKRFVKITGSRINLDEVEAILKDEFKGTAFYCMGFNDKQILVVTDDSAFDQGRIISFLSVKLNMHKSFIKTSFIAHIPLTENGKINYSLIQNQHVDG